MDPPGESSRLAGDDDGGWHNDKGAYLDPVQNAAADGFLDQAQRVEPRITESMQRIADSTPGSELTGLEYRLKTEDSFKEKLSSAIAEGPDLSVAEHLSDMKDSVRYTLRSTDDTYVQSVTRAIDSLLADGFEPVKFKNTWGQDGYQGINSFWRDPQTGHVFEVQFHTPASFDAKMSTHGLYEEARAPGTSEARAAELGRQQEEIFGAVPRPEGSSGIDLPPGSGRSAGPDQPNSPGPDHPGPGRDPAPDGGGPAKTAPTETTSDTPQLAKAAGPEPEHDGAPPHTAPNEHVTSGAGPEPFALEVADPHAFYPPDHVSHVLGLPEYRPGSLDSDQARVVYVTGEMRMAQLHEALLARGADLETRARTMFETRNEMRSWARELMSDRAAADTLTAFERNFTWDQVIEKYSGHDIPIEKAYERIIEKAMTSRPSVNDKFNIDPHNPPPLPPLETPPTGPTHGEHPSGRNDTTPDIPDDGPPPGESSRLAGDDDGGWHNDKGAYLDPVQNAAADGFLDQAQRVEPRITESMQRIADSTPGSELTGLEYRLKTEDSFKEKLSSAIAEGPDLSVAEHLSDMKDSVRYTLRSTDDTYVQSVTRAIDSLLADGFEPVKFKNTWGQDGYQGINSFWRDPQTGHVFEVQFHTPASFDAKMSTHGLYEEARAPGTSEARAAELGRQQEEIFGAVPRPEGSSGIDLPPGSGRSAGPDQPNSPGPDHPGPGRDGRNSPETGQVRPAAATTPDEHFDGDNGTPASVPPSGHPGVVGHHAGPTSDLPAAPPMSPMFIGNATPLGAAPPAATHAARPSLQLGSRGVANERTIGASPLFVGWEHEPAVTSPTEAILHAQDAPTGHGADPTLQASASPLRDAYFDQVEALTNLERDMRAAGSSEEDIARALHEARRGIGLKYQELTPEPVRSQIFQRNIERYGDPLGPTFEMLLQRGNSLDEIIESAKWVGGRNAGQDEK
ncbi:hypothetical protein [Mycolicibacterium fortuitum]|uniref:hypothetical protein n=1 Tax=Mycolicibacterium fortuitum TaxID=1766 RepID=UPI003AFF899C